MKKKLLHLQGALIKVLICGEMISRYSSVNYSAKVDIGSFSSTDLEELQTSSLHCVILLQIFLLQECSIVYIVF